MRTLTAERLRELLSYDPGTGLFHWRVYRNWKAREGSVAGCIGQLGYRYIFIDGYHYLAHRLAWLYTHGEWPAADLDHRFGVKCGDHLENLRPATRAQNQHNRRKGKNNTSGYKGVCWNKEGRKWVAKITFNYKVIHIGRFETKEAAHKAYVEAAIRYFGAFACEG